MKRSKPESVRVGGASVKIYSREKFNPTNRARYFVFEVADYTSGRRRLQSFSDHGEARSEAQRIARQLATGQAEAAMMSAPAAASYGRAIELLKPFGVSLEMAAAIYAKCHTILRGELHVEAAKFYAEKAADKITPRKVADVVAELVAHRQGQGKSVRYVRQLRALLKRFAKSFAVNLDTVSTADVQGWLDRLKLQPRSVKNYRDALSTLFSFAESRAYISKASNPVNDTERISTNGDGAIEIFTPREMDALLAAAPPSFVPFLVLGGFAGLRSAEIERLEWRDIDLADGFIHVAADKAKTRARRLVPMADNLRQWLAPYAKRNGNVWEGRPRDLLAVRAETAKKAKTPWKDNALRHSFVSYRLADIQDAAQVALEAGNSPAMVFKHYRELVKPEAAKAWFAIAPKAPANVISIPKAAP